MKRIILVAALALGSMPSQAAELTGDYYVKVEVVNERLAPENGEVVNRIYRGQKLTVYEVRRGWGLVTAPGYQARWVKLSNLSRERPEVAQWEPPAELKDSRIAAGSFVVPGEYGLSEDDVLTLWRGANMMLQNGTCNYVEGGDKSVSKANQYYIFCEGDNHFFTKSDLND
ncbi:hypothetical protein [Inquilinus sp. OTU3971]|uniref:hypothetical protein n=1 Tax=Inquilinus sp. OTU3971 TaxID=3043855 RepID=UPI00313DA2C7